ncbi:MAG: PIN domain-containing protein [Tepidisphaeraceae bacterium]|jgi:predicted nucleic acid-binding protein
MARRVLDTNVLINHWRRSFPLKGSNQIPHRKAVACARSLIELQNSNAILSPIYIEYLCGPQSAGGVENARNYLDQFEIVDEGRILPEDWKESKRIAGRVSRNSAPRDMGDCLIRAICNRLNMDVVTLDAHFPR